MTNLHLKHVKPEQLSTHNLPPLEYNRYSFMDKERKDAISLSAHVSLRQSSIPIVNEHTALSVHTTSP